MVLLSFELEVISNKSSSLVGEICELHIVLSHQRIFFYELLNFGKGGGNKVWSIESFLPQKQQATLWYHEINNYEYCFYRKINNMYENDVFEMVSYNY